MIEERLPPKPAALLPVCLCLLFALYPVPHTTALRNLVLLCAIASLAWTWRPWRQSFLPLTGSLAWAKPAGLLLAILATWIVLQSTFISPFPDRALSLLGGQGPVLLLLLFLGLAAAWRQPAPILRALVLALAGHVAILLAYQLYRVVIGWPAMGFTPFAQRDYHSLLNGFLLALLLADRLAAAGGKPSPLGLPRRAAWALLVMALVADACLLTRNGTLVTVTLIGLSGIWRLAGASPRTRAWTAVALLAAVLLAGLSIRHDPRWEGFSESVGVALDSDSSYWLDHSQAMPETPSGRPLETSAYLRAAWARQAVEAIGRHPLGLGFGHQAFGWAIELEYGRTGMESSHSGWLDFALANGLPGLALWLALSAWLIVAGWKRFRQAGDGTGLLLSFTVLAYLLRCLVDGHLAGWRLAMYILLTGTLLGAVSRRSAP